MVLENAASAGDAVINNTGAGGTGVSILSFFNTSTAGTAQITTSGSSVLQFQGTSTAGTPTSSPTTVDRSNFLIAALLVTPRSPRMPTRSPLFQAPARELQELRSSPTLAVLLIF
jgi:hypothetical protein